MDSLRKFLILLFGALSIFFAWIALLRHFGGNLAQFPWDPYDIETVAWNAGIGEQAQREERLIVINVDNSFTVPNDPVILDALQKHFMMADFDSRAFPADMTVLQQIFELGGASGSVKAGILSPQLTPILLTSRPMMNDKNGPLSIKPSIKAAVNVYKNHRAQTLKAKERIRAKFLLMHRRNALAQRLPLASRRMVEKAAKEPLDIIEFFNSDGLAASRAAAFSENARLAFRLSKSDLPPPIGVKKILVGVSRGVSQRYWDKTLRPSQRPLLARAMAEAHLHVSDEMSRKAFAAMADDILSHFDPMENLFFKDEDYPVAQNAAALSAMCYAYKIFEDEKYIAAAAKCAERLYEIFETSSTLPALALRRPSQASAKEYAQLARAMLDMRIVRHDEGYLVKFKELKTRLDRFHAAERKPLYYDNASTSAFAAFARTIDLDDGELPSAAGTMLQCLADLAALGADGAQGAENTILEALGANLSLKPFHNIGRPSLKLAVLKNPLLGN